jgi:hypothetical protein
MSNQGSLPVPVRFAGTLAAAVLLTTFPACGGVPEEARNDDIAVTTSAITRVINVSNVTDLYAAFKTANSS